MHNTLPTPAFNDEKHHLRIYQGDCLDILAQIPPSSVDLVFADPPYFLSNGGVTCHAGKMVSVNKGSWDKSQGPDANHAFNTAWLAACQRVLKPNGAIWVSGTAHVIHSVGFAMQQLGFKLLNDISWVAYEKLRPLETLNVQKRGWTLDVLQIVKGLNKREFMLKEVYDREDALAGLHPNNTHVRDKIRQQLQVLRDIGLVFSVAATIGSYDSLDKATYCDSSVSNPLDNKTEATNETHPPNPLAGFGNFPHLGRHGPACLCHHYVSRQSPLSHLRHRE